MSYTSGNTNATRAAAVNYQELAAAFRNEAEYLVRDAEILTATTLDHTRQLATVYGESAYGSAQRSRRLATEAWKTWADAATSATNGFPGVTGNPGFGFPSVSVVDVKETIAAGVDLVKGMLDAQRELVERLVGATAANATAANAR